MQKMSLWLASLFVALLLNRCTKKLESTPSLDLEELPTVSNSAASPSVVSCLITKLVQDYGGIKNPAYFTYDGYKNPVSIVFTHGGTGNPSWYFKYDAKHRLVRLDKKYPNGPLVETHKYGYNQYNAIGKDSAHYYEGGEIVIVSSFTYDQKQRLNKESFKEIKNNGGPFETFPTIYYNYDVNNNLVVNGWAASKYDHKVSPLRTHKLWQFLHRNYSVNSPAVQSSYNTNGLPTIYKIDNDLFFNGGPTSEIQYLCK
ncbi:MAG: hypothetical protein ABI687_08870 [Flavitalea sp.]